ncbi:Uncharacterised protein [Campylobacter geochelonis]|uniref:Uncharacterized protein n=1 Tax=Campylobacter geochelonis TaxID=1780362 RepID=A0A128ELJ9_9BACT|nr:hypothetical protein CGEO_1169 [Campylobacter geochelonis]QKF71482.1 hypothetical protein CGEO_1184 [Campylobacter geochelonis]CZE49322.1 Uncharacterised protein [Campylobacter geochelonis]
MITSFFVNQIVKFVKMFCLDLEKVIKFSFLKPNKTDKCKLTNLIKLDKYTQQYTLNLKEFTSFVLDILNNIINYILVNSFKAHFNFISNKRAYLC